MKDVWSLVRSMWWNLSHRMGIIDVIDVLIVAVIIYELLLLTRHTRGSALLKGLFLLFVIVILSKILGLTSLNWLLLAVLQNGALVLVILFQPELRKALERMGRSRFITKGNHRNDEEDTDVIIDEIIQTVVDLSRRRVGALIVFERKTGLQDVMETGTRIVAAACILPLAEASGVIRGLGTRHRAAVGISENTDAAVIVVSEQTGIISLAMDGTLQRPYSIDAMRSFLRGFYSSRESGISSFLRGIFKRNTGANINE